MKSKPSISDHLRRFLAARTMIGAQAVLGDVPNDLWSAFRSNASVALHRREQNLNPFIGRDPTAPPVGLSEFAGGLPTEIAITELLKQALAEAQFQRRR